MAGRVYVCSAPGCPNKVAGRQGRCADCKAQDERQRPSRQERGYDAAYERERLRWAPVVAQGTVTCARCRELIRRGEPWQLDHDDDDRDRYLGPSHKPCNLSAAAVKGNKARKGR